MKLKSYLYLILLFPLVSYSQKYDIKYTMDYMLYLMNLPSDSKEPTIGFLNKKGEIVIDSIYSKGFYFKDGIANVVKDGVYGYITHKNQLRLFPQFKKAFWDGTTGIAVDENKKYALIDRDGKLITEFLFTKLEKKDDNYYFGELNKKGIFLNLEGKLLFDENYDLKDGINNSVASFRAETGKKLGLVNTDGTIISEPIYDKIYGKPDSPYWTVSKNGKFGVLNSDGKAIIPVEYDKIEYTVQNESFIPVLLNGKYGYVNADNKLVIPYMYEKALPFIEGFAIVKRDGKYGYITQKNADVAFFGSETFWIGEAYFNEGLAIFKLNGKCGFIDKSGKIIVDALYDKVENFKSGLARVNQDGLYGFIDKTGKVVIPVKYSYLSNVNEDKILFQL